LNEHNVPRRRYTLEFRGKATRLANSVGHNLAARRLGVPVSTIGNESRRSAAQSSTAIVASDVSAGTRAKLSMTKLEAEVSRLRKELANAELDEEIVSKHPIFPSWRCGRNLGLVYVYAASPWVAVIRWIHSRSDVPGPCPCYERRKVQS
jgi:transposase